MINLIRISNYKCLQDFELRLGPTCLLVGRNASGKSSVLEVLDAVRDLVLRDHDVEDCFPPESLTRWSKSTDQRVEIEGTFRGRPLLYSLAVRHDGAPRIVSEIAGIGDATFASRRENDDRVRLFDVGAAGTHLAASSWNKPTKSMFSLLPSSDEAAVFRAWLSAICPTRLLFEDTNDLTAGQRVIAWLETAAEAMPPDGVLCLDGSLDQIELASVQPLMVLLRERAEDRSAQLVVASHHPEVVNYLQDCAILLARDENGATRVRSREDIASRGNDGLMLSEILARGWEE